jgi:hypothetical protein
MEWSENKTKKKQKTAIIFASKRNEAERKRKTDIIFSSKWNEAKQKRKNAIIFEAKFFRFDAKKCFFACFRIWGETKMKLSEKTFISFRF